jgi:hypothetical protein
MLWSWVLLSELAGFWLIRLVVLDDSPNHAISDLCMLHMKRFWRR